MKKQEKEILYRILHILGRLAYSANDDHTRRQIEEIKTDIEMSLDDN